MEDLLTRQEQPVGILRHSPFFLLGDSVWLCETFLETSLPGWVSTDPFHSGYTVSYCSTARSLIMAPVQRYKIQDLCKGAEWLLHWVFVVADYSACSSCASPFWFYSYFAVSSCPLFWVFAASFMQCIFCNACWDSWLTIGCLFMWLHAGISCLASLACDWATTCWDSLSTLCMLE